MPLFIIFTWDRNAVFREDAFSRQIQQTHKSVFLKESYSFVNEDPTAPTNDGNEESGTPSDPIGPQKRRRRSARRHHPYSGDTPVNYDSPDVPSPAVEITNAGQKFDCFYFCQCTLTHTFRRGSRFLSEM